MRSAKRRVSAIASGQVAEQPRHFRRRFQMTFGIGLKPGAGLASSVTCSRMQVTTSCKSRRSGCVIKHIIDGDQRHAARSRASCLQVAQAAAVVAGVQHGRRQPGIAVPGAASSRHAHASADRRAASRSAAGRAGIAAGRRNPADIRPFPRAQLADGQAAGKPAIGFAVLRIGQDVRRAVAEHQPRADQQAWAASAQLLPGFIGAHHAGQGVAVGDADGGMAQLPPPVRRIRLDARRRAGRRNWW